MSTVVECPDCGAQLDLKDRAQPGQRVRCPRCKEIFVAGGKPGRASRPSVKRHPTSSRDHSAGDRAVPEQRRRPPASKKSKPRKKSGSTSPIVFVVLGLGFIVVAAISAGAAYVIWGTEDGDAPTVAGTGDSNASSVPDLPAQPNAITEREADAFAEKLEQAVNSGDQSTVVRLLNYSSIVERAMENLEAPSRWKQGFAKGLVGTGPRLAQAIITQARSDDGSYMFVRRVDDGGRQQALFRLISSEGGLNYHRFDLVRVGGEVRIGDIFLAASGENMSTSFHRLCLASAPDQSFLERLAGKEKLFVKHGKQILATQQAFAAGNFQAGMQSYNQLPTEIQREKFLLLLRIKAAAQGNFNNPEYLQALEAFQSAFPRSSAADLIAIDVHVIRKEFDKALAAIDRLDQFIGTDPYLDISRGTVNFAKGDNKTAEGLIRPLLHDPKLGRDATISYLDVVLALKDHEATLETLLRLESNYGLQFPRDLSGTAGFEFFASSQQHRRFKSR